MKCLAKALMYTGCLFVATALSLLVLADADGWAEFWADLRGEGLITHW